MWSAIRAPISPHLPAAGRQLPLSVVDHCLRSEDYVNVIVADKQPHLVYLDMDAAIIHCTKGIGIWEWASNDGGAEPDVVVASAGDILTQEALAAVAIFGRTFPDLKIRFVNVVDLYRLQPEVEHPHGLSDRDFDSLFTRDKPVIFNFHGYPWLIHKFTYRRTNHANIHVAATRKRATSILHWNLRSVIRLTGSTWRSMSSIAFPGCKLPVRISRNGSKGKSSKASTMLTLRAWTNPRSETGDGRSGSSAGYGRLR